MIPNNFNDCIIYLVEDNQEIIKMSLDMKLINKDILFKFFGTNFNVLSMMLNSNNIKIDIVKDIIKEYCDPDEFSIPSSNYPTNNVNIYYDVINNIPDLALELLHDDIFLEDNLMSEFNNGTPMYFVIMNTIDNSQFITELINSKYFTSEYLMHKLSTGENLILNMMNNNSINLQYLISNNKCKHGLYFLDDKNNNILISYLNSTINLDTYLKLIEICTQELLLHKNNNGNNPFLIACNMGYQYAVPLINHKFFNESVFNAINNNGTTCLISACKSGDYEFVKYLCSTKYITKDIFNKKDSYNKSPIYYSFQHVKIFDYIINHEYCDQELVMEQIIFCVNNYCNIYENITILLKSNKFCERMYYIFVHYLEKYIINIIFDNYEKTKNYIQFENITNDTLKLTNKYGRNIIMESTISKNDELYNKLLNLNIMDHNILKMRDYAGRTLFHLLIKYNKNEKFSELVNKFSVVGLEGVFGELLVLQDNSGNTILHTAIKNNNLEIIDIILNHKLCTKELLACTDINGNNIMHYCYENIELLNRIINHNCFTVELLEQFNNKNINPFMIICGIYDEHKIVCDILQLKEINNRVIINSNISGLNHIIGLYPKSKILGYILESEKFDLTQCINVIPQLNPLLYTIKTHNNKALQLLLNCKYDLRGLFNMSECELLNLMVTHGFDIFKTIFESKYFSKIKLLTNKTLCDNLLIEIFKFGNYKLMKYMYDNKYYNQDYLELTDKNGDTVLYKCVQFKNAELLKFMCDSENGNNYIHSNLLFKKNNIGMTCLQYYCLHNQDIFNIIFNSKHCTENLVHSKDRNNNTILHSAIIKGSPNYTTIINSQYINKKILSIQNKFKETPLM